LQKSNNPFLLSEKNGIFSDMSQSPQKHTSTDSAQSKPRRGESVDATIRAQITKAQVGKVFTPTDFIHLGSRAAIDKVLSRLVSSGELRRIGRGLYDRSQKHPLFGELLPSADEISQAVAGKGSLRIQPSGAYAANLLGLSEQVPLKLQFLTDGASRTVQVGNQIIILRHTTPKNMATAGRISGLVIQALRHLKQPNVDEQIISRIRQHLSAEDKVVLLTDASLAPAWIANIMRRIVHEES
jgi:hypothetical protein